MNEEYFKGDKVEITFGEHIGKTGVVEATTEVFVLVDYGGENTIWLSNDEVKLID